MRKATCSGCGRTVWLRKVATQGFSGPAPSGTPIFQWCARRGSKPRPIECPVSDGWPTTYHKVEGEPTTFYGDPADPIVTR